MNDGHREADNIRQREMRNSDAALRSRDKKARLLA